MSAIKLSAIPTLRALYKNLNISNTQSRMDVRPELLDRVSLFQGDITKLEVDAIVNAAKKSLLGSTLNGALTGEAKITKGYKLPASKELFEKHCRAVFELYDAFCAISTGIYGYPIKDATHIAFKVTREYLDALADYKIRPIGDSLVGQPLPPRQFLNNYRAELLSKVLTYLTPRRGEYNAWVLGNNGGVLIICGNTNLGTIRLVLVEKNQYDKAIHNYAISRASLPSSLYCTHVSMGGSRTLTNLPAELIYELYLWALSPSFPFVSRYVYSIIKSCSPNVHARYILGRHTPTLCRSDEGVVCISGQFLTRALRYPICTIPVLEVIPRLIADNLLLPSEIPNATLKDTFELPKRIFRSLDYSSSARPPGFDSDPLPLLRVLWRKASTTRTSSPPSMIGFIEPSANLPGGYPLFRAVHARFPHLIQFLLDRGADPKLQKYAAVKAAIIAKDLEIVKMLIECGPEQVQTSGSNKKRKRTDRLNIEGFLLDLAVRVDARDIVRYFMVEKGGVPDMKTLRHIHI
ncbi:hypothetical protein Clacol_002331 [Clathrus columnatus]|uniref:Uncharacterized protein n=1 Tax=Clathrus columnatus TaxID=1419009 RepID=A0AAV5A4K0_9AGAM|nr:hypothetical protein Clacol_002331 [Clathrus columnatus]